MIKHSAFFLFISIIFLPQTYAIGQKHYIQIGSCYLQKCVQDKIKKAQTYNWPLTMHRQSNSHDVYQVLSSMAFDEVDADIHFTTLMSDDAFVKKADLQGTEFGFYLSVGVYKSVQDAYLIKDKAEALLSEDKIRFSIKRRQKRAESTKIMVGPYNTLKAAREQKRKIRETPEFPNAFMVIKE